MLNRCNRDGKNILSNYMTGRENQERRSIFLKITDEDNNNTVFDSLYNAAVRNTDIEVAKFY